MDSNSSTIKEGKLAKEIEDVTARVSSDKYLWGAVGAMVVSAGYLCAGKKHTALFIGQWAAPLLIMGLYNKLVKVEGHEGEKE
ncbi:MAG: hypothetical protein NVV59_00260 [Chitinophagaceae bacterium]|nr:hypothetical protein [Chitinophagaceae bacterium]